MNNRPPPACPHKRGFNCPICYPRRPEYRDPADALDAARHYESKRSRGVF